MNDSTTRCPKCEARLVPVKKFPDRFMCPECGYKQGFPEVPVARGGRRRSLSDRLREVLDTAYIEDIDNPIIKYGPMGPITLGDILAQRAVENAMTDASFFREIMNRIDGKIADKVHHGIDPDQLDDDQRDRVARILAIESVKKELPDADVH